MQFMPMEFCMQSHSIEKWHSQQQRAKRVPATLEQG